MEGSRWNAPDLKEESTQPATAPKKPTGLAGSRFAPDNYAEQDEGPSTTRKPGNRRDASGNRGHRSRSRRDNSRSSSAQRQQTGRKDEGNMNISRDNQLSANIAEAQFLSLPNTSARVEMPAFAALRVEDDTPPVPIFGLSGSAAVSASPPTPIISANADTETQPQSALQQTRSEYPFSPRDAPALVKFPSPAVEGLSLLSMASAPQFLLQARSDSESERPVVINNRTLFPVRILTSSVKFGELEYRVKWANSEESANWLPASVLKHHPFLIREFHLQHVQEPRPPMFLKEWVVATRDGLELEDGMGGNRVMEGEALANFRVAGKNW